VLALIVLKQLARDVMDQVGEDVVAVVAIIE